MRRRSFSLDRRSRGRSGGSVGEGGRGGRGASPRGQSPALRRGHRGTRPWWRPGDHRCAGSDVECRSARDPRASPEGVRRRRDRGSLDASNRPRRPARGRIRPPEGGRLPEKSHEEPSERGGRVPEPRLRSSLHRLPDRRAAHRARRGPLGDLEGRARPDVRPARGALRPRGDRERTSRPGGSGRTWSPSSSDGCWKSLTGGRSTTRATHTRSVLRDGTATATESATTGPIPRSRQPSHGSWPISTPWRSLCPC